MLTLITLIKGSLEDSNLQERDKKIVAKWQRPLLAIGNMILVRQDQGRSSVTL